MNRLFIAALVALLSVPAVAVAQEASIAGTVTDSTGSVLPGVTVEATSPVLIEKSRAVVTDGSGRYRIVNLPPGSYVVRFVLPGFATVERPGIQLSGSFAATVNGELSVGSLEDTITVTGASPIIDTQNVTQQRVMNREVLDLIPVGRTAHDVGILLPFSRHQESEADEIGLFLMAKAGYDPRQSIEFWKRMEQTKDGAPPEFLSTHPSDETRIKRIEGWMPEALRMYEAQAR